jgi:flagellin-specific chaperone FliS
MTRNTTGSHGIRYEWRETRDGSLEEWEATPVLNEEQQGKVSEVMAIFHDVEARPDMEDQGDWASALATLLSFTSSEIAEWKRTGRVVKLP